jgi:hypothetical protein
VDGPGPMRSDLPPLPPRKSDLPPRSMGADFFNGDNGLHAFSRFAPTAPTKLKRYPERRTRSTVPMRLVFGCASLDFKAARVPRRK